MEEDRGYTPQNNDSFAQTVDEHQNQSRNSNVNPNISATPTDESTIPHQVPPVVNNQLQDRTNTPVQTPSQTAFTTHKSAAPKFTPSLHYQSTPQTHQSQYSVHDSRELIVQLEYTISMLETQMLVIKDHAEQQIQILNERYKHEEDKLETAVELLANERAVIIQEKQELSNQLANTRVELKNVRDQLKDSKSKHTGDTQGLNQKLKTIGEDRIKLQSELSGLKVKFNDLRKVSNDQKSRLEVLEADNKRLKENNIKISSSNTQLRLQNQSLQQLAKSCPTCDSDVRPANEQSMRQSRPSSEQSMRQVRPRTESSQSRPSSERSAIKPRPNSSLRFSNRTQVRDISPPKMESLVQPDSPQGIGSEIHTTSCRYNCHLFEHEGGEGRFRWVCGLNDRVVIVYREQRFVIFIPGIAEIQLYGDGAERGQLIIFWTSNESTKEITVFRLNGNREEYRIDEGGHIIYREIFYSDGTASRITGDQLSPIDPEDETPLLAQVETIRLEENDLQIRHHAFGLRIVNFEFLRVQIFQERLQITMCLCDGKRVFNVKHCDENFQQKSLCTFLGQCPNMPIR